MPKENKNTSRKNRRQCTEVDHESAPVSSTRESIKSVIASNRYSPFPREVPRRDIKLEKENMSLSSIEILRSMSDGIIGSGIKYIMFPLHLLHFCIFRTNSESVDSDKKTEIRQATTNNETEKREEAEETKKNRDEKKTRNSETLNRRCSKEDRGNSQFRSSSTAVKQNSKQVEGKNGNEESTDEMVTAAEDSDSSVDHWSSASSMMNMSVDCDNIGRSKSYTILEEPMDISFEEQTYEKPCPATKTLEGTRVAGKFRTVTTGSKSLKSFVDDQDSNSSVDEEIAKIFQKQCTSSEDELSFSNSKPLSSDKCEKKNFLCNRSNSRYSTSVFRSKKESENNETGRKKKPSLDIVINHKRRKLVDDEDRDEKEIDDKTETKTREEKRGSRQTTLNKSKARSSKTSVQSKESKRKDVKYKETATQTDSAFSDEDVEMIPVETKLPERQFCCKYAAQRLQPDIFQGTKMEQELNYVADNEDSNDGYMGTDEHKRISSCSASSSSTDLGFDERVSATPNTDVAIEQWRSNSPDNVNTFRTCIRAPPGFPKLPQNPPLTSYDCNNSKYFMKAVLKNNCSNSAIVPSSVIVPPAPSPMRHLYYDYPEFMDLPVNINSSKFLTNILRNNYYR